MAAKVPDPATIALVDGFVPKCDVLPSDVRARGFSIRCAVVLHTHSEVSSDMVFRAAAYVAAVASIAKILGATSLSVREEPDAAPVVELDLARASELLAGREEPAHRVELRDAAGICGIAESEPWAYAGGPHEYHDAFVVAVYTRSRICESLADALSRWCSDTGNQFDGVTVASASPFQPTLWQRALWLFGA